MSHETARRMDARDVLNPGQLLTGVIIEETVDDVGTSLTKIENIKTFVRPGDHELQWGDTVWLKIVDVGESHAEAIALDVAK